MIHPRMMCDGHPCPFHHPSDHHMKDWPTHTRASRLVERICPHGAGHPDPDSLAYFRRAVSARVYESLQLEEHACDSCCSERPPVPAAFTRAWD